MTDVEITDFLLARIAEDEELARSASFLRPSGPDPAYVSITDGLRRMQQRFDPARVLAECEAKRRIVEWCSARMRVWVGRLGDDPTDTANYVPGDHLQQADVPTLRFLALPYADHPDFREEWRP